MSTGLFVIPEDLVIDFKKVPKSLFDETKHSPLHQIKAQNNGGIKDGKEALDMNKIYNTDEIISMFDHVRKMYNYLNPEYLSSWEVFLISILTQNPDAQLIEFHFVYTGGVGDLPFFFRAVRSYGQLKFATFVGDESEPWCSSMQDITEDDWSEWQSWQEDNEEYDNNGKGPLKKQKTDATPSFVTTTSAVTTTGKKPLPQKLKLDLEKYRAGYKTHVPEFKLTPDQIKFFRLMEFSRKAGINLLK